MRHRLGATSTLDGGGTVRSVGDVLALDLAFEATPLRLETVAAFVPGLDSLRGPASGLIALSGTTDSLVVSGDVRTDGGPLAFEGTIDTRRVMPRFMVTARSESFTPSRVGLIEAEGQVSGSVIATLEGDGVETMRGPIRIDLDSAVIAGLPVQRSHATVSLDSGRVVVDSSEVRVPGLRVAAEGAFGLVASRPDSLRLILDSEAFDPLERVLFDDIADPMQPRVAGRGRAVASLYGSIEGFDASIDATLEDVLYDGRTVEAAHIVGSGSALRTDSLAWTVNLRADSLNALDGFADSLFATIERDGDSGQVRVLAWRDSLRSVRFASSFDLTETGMHRRTQRGLRRLPRTANKHTEQ
jgi:hypothetical protein